MEYEGLHADQEKLGVTATAKKTAIAAQIMSKVEIREDAHANFGWDRKARRVTE